MIAPSFSPWGYSTLSGTCCSSPRHRCRSRSPYFRGRGRSQVRRDAVQLAADLLEQIADHFKKTGYLK